MTTAIFFEDHQFFSLFVSPQSGEMVVSLKQVSS
jgi:hypothetical protein